VPDTSVERDIVAGVGEPRLGGIAELVGLVFSASRRPLLVGVDGQGGAGKSTLARALSNALAERSVVVEGDDFYSDIDWDERALFEPADAYERNFDWQRLRDQVLLPVRQAARTLRYQRYDWDQTRMGGWIEMPMPGVVIVEGVYSLRPQLRDLLDVKAFVDASAVERLSRMRARHAGYQRELQVRADAWIERWEAAEQFYLAQTKPRNSADIAIDGEDPGLTSAG
jgi:uridine kinase